MVDETNAQAGTNALKAEEVQAQHDTIIRQMRSGELLGRAKVVLITGYAGAGKSNLLKLITRSAIQIGHGTTNGTVDALCQFVNLENELFVFIDTPGFGTAGYSASQIRGVIQGTLGFATRCFGGIHGVLYLHSIETDREYTGIKESLEFLRNLKREDQLPTLTFVTTKWDRVRDEERQLYEDRVTHLENTSWREFTGHGYIEFGCNYDYSSPKTRQAERTALVEQLLGQYGRANLVPVVMPFWEWTWGEIGTGIAVVTAQTAAVGFFGYLAAPVLVPLAIAAAAIGLIQQELREGRLSIGINTNGVYVEHPELGRRHFNQ